jgi:hypothetical protein
MRKPVLWIFIVVLCAFSDAHAQSVPAGLADSVKLFPGSQLQVQATSPISIELNDDSRTAYETLAKLAGLNMIVDSSFRPVPVSLKLKDVGILQAFDILSAQTLNFIEVVDNKTILVAPDNQTFRRHYQTQVLETVYLNDATTPQEVTKIITALRTSLNLSFIAQSTTPPAILLKEVPDKIVLAEKIIADAEKSGSTTAPSIAFDVAGNLLISDRGNVRRVRPPRLELKPKSTGPFSFDMNNDSRTIYESLARMAGFNIVFDPQFRPVRVPFKFDNVDIFDALDFLGLQTASFYEVLNSNTIWVAPDNQTSRRQYENLMLETIYLPAGTASVKMTETITALRTLLNMSFIAQGTGVKAILLRDTPLKLALAEKVVAEMNPSAPLPKSTMWAGSVNLPHPVRESALEPLDIKLTAPVSIDVDQSAKEAYTKIATLAGLNVTFDDTFRDTRVHFRLDNVTILDALDVLGLQTMTFWQPVDSKTIIVGPDNQTTRRKIEPLIEGVFPLTNATTSTGITEIVTALRTLLNVGQIETRDNTIVMRDVAGKIPLAQKVIADLDKAAR